MAYFQSQITEDVDLSRLTAIELQILKFIKEGYSSPQIAGFRNCSSRTVEKHRSNIIQKLQLKPKPNSLLIWAYKNAKLFTT
ncbi:MAG: helix-turn-helix transcriptional regulator [Flavobacteriaceae bacterium]|nr:helix-turn-helix transcriptional regulator [Flavobacteriaceae bacterium]